VSELVLKFISGIRSERLSEGWNTLLSARKRNVLARIENAFVSWQSSRLAELPAERLWAMAMQDTRSFAEIRRQRKGK